ncbi:MAG: hypothetical protein BroJett029_32040 [Alphaproteobacteria bacterium]|nr:MAG: hypothetical protein BroJett029_32040 [Alphaproteobacteria bacterium]
MKATPISTGTTGRITGIMSQPPAGRRPLQRRRAQLRRETGRLAMGWGWAARLPPPHPEPSKDAGGTAALANAIAYSIYGAWPRL